MPQNGPFASTFVILLGEDPAHKPPNLGVRTAFIDPILFQNSAPTPDVM